MLKEIIVLVVLFLCIMVGTILIAGTNYGTRGNKVWWLFICIVYASLVAFFMAACFDSNMMLQIISGILVCFGGPLLSVIATKKVSNKDYGDIPGRMYLGGIILILGLVFILSGIFWGIISIIL